MTEPAPVFAIRVTASVAEPPTVSADALLNSMLSAEVGAVVAAAPPTSQLPGTAQSPPLAPFHVYVPAKAALAAIIAPKQAIFLISCAPSYRRAPLMRRADPA